MEEQSNRPNALTAEKNKALAAALAHIEKQFGKGSVMRPGGRNLRAGIVRQNHAYLASHRRNAEGRRHLRIYRRRARARRSICIETRRCRPRFADFTTGYRRTGA